MPTILVVDDDPSIRSMLSLALGDEGYEVVTATNGSEGLEQVRRCQPAVILLDLMMPVMDGGQMLQRLREQQDTTPVVLLSAVFRQYRADVLPQAGAHLAKPFNLDALFRLVERYTL